MERRLVWSEGWYGAKVVREQMKVAMDRWVKDGCYGAKVSIERRSDYIVHTCWIMCYVYVCINMYSLHGTASEKLLLLFFSCSHVQYCNG